MKSVFRAPGTFVKIRRGTHSAALKRVLMVGTGALGLVSFASAQSVWTNGDSNNQWSDSLNWSGGLPQDGYSVSITGVLSNYQEPQADNVGISLSSLTMKYAGLNLNSSGSGNSNFAISGLLSVTSAGINVNAGSSLSASTASFSGSGSEQSNISNLGVTTFSNSFTMIGGNIFNTDVFSANAFSLQSSHALDAFYNKGTATFTDSFNFVGAFYQTTASYIDSDTTSGQINLNMASGTATVNNGILEATNGGQIGGSIGNLTITQGGVLTADGSTSAVNITAGSLTNQFLGEAGGTQPYNNSTISATNSGQLTINATNVLNTNVYTQGDGVYGDAFIEAGSGGILTLNVSGTLTNNDYIEALAGGTVNVSAPNVNGSGALNAIGVNAQLNVSGNTYYGQYVTTMLGGAAYVGTLSSPIAQYNEGGLQADNSMYGEASAPGTQIQAYVTSFDGLITTAEDDFIGAADGATVNLTGSTYVGSLIYSRTNYAGGGASTLNITESTSVGGLGYIEAVGTPTPSTGTNQLNISAPTITFDYPQIEAGPHGLVFLDASTSLTLDDNGTYTYLNYSGFPASVEAAGGEVLLQCPEIQIAGTATSPILLQSIGGFGLLKINATGPNGLISITNQGVASLQTASAQSGSIELDGAEVINGLNSYLVAGESEGSIVFNNSSASGLDSQNAGTLSAVLGNIVVGGSTFENESTGLISIAQIGNLDLGYTLPAPNGTPTVSSELLTTTNYGQIDIYGNLTSNGTLMNAVGGTISVNDFGSVDFYQYYPGVIDVTAGDFNNAGLTTLTASNLTVVNGNLINSGTLAINDDLSGPSYPFSSIVTTDGGFLNSGKVNVLGSMLNINGTLTNTGNFTVQDDDSGGVAYGNNYPDQQSFLVINGTLDNSSNGSLIGNLTVLNSEVQAYGTGSIVNENGASMTLTNSTLYVFQGTLNNETGASMTLLDSPSDLKEGTVNNESGAFLTVTGSTLTIGDGSSPAAVAINNTGGATFTINNDYSAVAGGGTPKQGTVVVFTGDVQNSSSATLDVYGGGLSVGVGDFINSTNAKFEVYDDLSQGAAVGPVTGNAYLGQNLTNSSGALVDVLGSNLTVQNTLTNDGGIINVRDDNTGGAAFGNSYSTQNGSLTVSSGDLLNENSGMITVTESALVVSVGTITNQNNATFTVQDDSTLAQPGGAVLVAQGAGGLVNTDSAIFNVIGSRLNVSNTLTNEGAATFMVTTDDTAYVSSGGAASMVTGVVSADQISNSGSANFKVIGAEVNADEFTNSGNGVVTIDQLADGNNSGNVQITDQFTNGSSQTDAAKVNVINGEIYLGNSGNYFQTGANSKTYVGLNGAIYSKTGTFTLGNLGDPAGSAGYLGGSGSVIMNVVNNAGTIDPGDPQVLTIIGGLIEGPNGTLAFNIDGPGGPGVGNDQLVVSGDVTLAGTLDLIFGPGYSPSGTFNILDVVNGTVTGDFSTLEETINGQTTILHGNIVIGPGGLTYNAVPEPAPWLALGGAALGVLCRRRKKSR